MGVIYVARSVKLGKWASDVGLSKNVFKIGYAEEPVAPLVEKGWAGESDWTLVKAQEVDGLSESTVIDRLARKEKMIDPNFYPKLKGAKGVFKVLPTNVENHMLVQHALANLAELKVVKLKPADFADYMIKNATA